MAVSKKVKGVLFASLPASIQHYTLQALLGEGDIGVVYQALNERTGQTVALKVLRADSPVADAARYFENERSILADLTHPHIPTLYDYLPGESPCLALSLIPGQDGDQLLAELPVGQFLPPWRVVRWGVDIADALAYLHQHQPPITFRDLKPSHLRIDSGDHAWLVDFNLALALPPDQAGSDHGEPMGTEGFAPPEQYDGSISPLVDVYALGATLHHLLTRIDPRHERRFTYAPPRAINPAISKAVAQVIMQALAYEPEDRFQSMAAMRDALTNALADT